jgi:hypothetical protein
MKKCIDRVRFMMDLQGTDFSLNILCLRLLKIFPKS